MLPKVEVYICSARSGTNTSLRFTNQFSVSSFIFVVATLADHLICLAAFPLDTPEPRFSRPPKFDEYAHLRETKKYTVL